MSITLFSSRNTGSDWNSTIKNFKWESHQVDLEIRQFAKYHFKHAMKYIKHCVCVDCSLVRLIKPSSGRIGVRGLNIYIANLAYVKTMIQSSHRFLLSKSDFGSKNVIRVVLGQENVTEVRDRYSMPRKTKSFSEISIDRQLQRSTWWHIDWLMLDRRSFIANALELRLSCNNLSIYC